MQRLISSSANRPPLSFTTAVQRTIKRNMEALIGGTIVVAAGLTVYHWDKISEHFQTRRILNAFEGGRGYQQWEDVDTAATVSRDTLKQHLTEIFMGKYPKTYAVILGQHGCGTSTAVRQAIASLSAALPQTTGLHAFFQSRKQPKGVVYINTEDPYTFAVDLKELLGVKTFLDFRHSMPKTTFETLRPVLKTAAADFKRTHNRPLVLVVDSADRLAKNEKVFFCELQDFAKDCADLGDLCVVFIISKGSRLSLLEERSAWSRASEPMEVGEISDEQAVEYLTKHKVPQELAKEAVATMTGGNFALLNKFTASYERETIPKMRAEMDTRLTNCLAKHGLAVNHPLFSRLLNEKRITKGASCRELGWCWRGQDKLDALVADGVLMECGSGEYAFLNRHAVDFFHRQLDGQQSEQGEQGSWWPW